LQEEARRRRVSVAHLVRTAIRRELDLLEEQDAEAIQRFLAASGCATEPDERTDVARTHDEHQYGDPG